MLITRISQFSKKENSKELPITKEQLDAFNNGMHVQTAFPHLSPDDREFILTGITKEEWDEMFPEEDEEDDEDYISSQHPPSEDMWKDIEHY